MPKVEKLPGHGVVPGGAATTPDQPARARHLRADHAPAGDEQAPAPRSGSHVLRWAWVVAFVSLAAGLTALQSVDAPTLARQAAAAALGVVLCLGLAVRSGSHATLATTFALTVGVVAVATQWEPALGGAAVGTAVVAACLAVLGTRPAARFRSVVVEVVVALLVAATGGLGAAELGADLDTERFAYTVLVLTLLSITGLVHRLAGGMHSLGRRGLVLAVGALVLLVVVLVYTAALTEYGSPELVRQVRAAQDWTRESLGGVPHPVEVLVGIPALAWGVSLRSRRRQGWWACAFGTAATAHVASDLHGNGDWTLSSTLAVVYGLVLGLVLGAVLIRLERLLTGRGDRPSRGAPPVVLRQEPPRLQPLH